MDYIRLKNLVFFARHGMLQQEREIGQRFEVDVELSGDLKAAGRSDDLSQTYNYDRIYRIVEAVVIGERFNIIEALAESICANLLETYPDVRVTVVVRKPQAPLPGLFEAVEVELQRGPLKPLDG